MMREIEFTILENKPITDDICKMVLECSAGEHGITAPGQFINIKIDGLFLRRPISICDWTETTVTVIYKVVGKGTELLKTYEPGRQLNALRCFTKKNSRSWALRCWWRQPTGAWGKKAL